MLASSLSAFTSALGLTRKECSALVDDLSLVTSSVRCGAMLPRMDSAVHVTHLPASCPPCTLVDLGGPSFCLSTALLAAKCSALGVAAAAAAAAGTASTLASACAASAAVAPIPILIGGPSCSQPRLLTEAELAAWLPRYAAALAGLLAGSSSALWQGASHGPHRALTWVGGELASHGLCPVALAGLFLDYPAVYDLGHASVNCLGGIDLAVYSAGPIAFSIPCALEAACALASWRALLQQRATAAGQSLEISRALVNRTSLVV